LISEVWGFVGFAADIYGSDLQTVTNLTERGELATLYRSNATLFSERIQTAVDLIKEHPLVNPDQIAVFGYCFGKKNKVFPSIFSKTALFSSCEFQD
jgi:dienelactone hydrolase